MGENPQTYSHIYEHVNCDPRGAPEQRGRKSHPSVSGSVSTGYPHRRE